MGGGAASYGWSLTCYFIWKGWEGLCFVNAICEVNLLFHLQRSVPSYTLSNVISFGGLLSKCIKPISRYRHLTFCIIEFNYDFISLSCMPNVFYCPICMLTKLHWNFYYIDLNWFINIRVGPDIITDPAFLVTR